MKVKFSLDFNAVREFFVRHLEKIVFAGVVLSLMFFVFAAIGREVIDLTPDKLGEYAQITKNAILKYPPETPFEAHEYDKDAERIKIPIEKNFYGQPTVWQAPLFHQEGLIEVPPLLPVAELRGTSGYGPLTMANITPGARHGRAVRGRRWVVLTGLLSVMEQTKAYLQAFEDNKKPEAIQGRGLEGRNVKRDVPVYAWYYIERAEVNRRDETGQLKWTQLNTGRATAVTDEWGTGRSTREVVHDVFIPSVYRGGVPMVFPLPPLAEGKWAAEVAHEPQIPLLVDRSQLMPGQYGAMEGVDGPGGPGDPGAAEAAGETDDPAAADGPVVVDGPGAIDGPGMMEGPGMMQEGPGAGGYPAGPGYDDYQAFDGPEADLGRGHIRRRRIPGRAGMYEEEEVAHKLFRFFDFSVEPGKHYRYRVRLLLVNPLKGIPTWYLADEQLSKMDFVETDPSDPTEVVSVPRDSRLLAVSVKPSPWPTVPPSSSVLAVTFRMDDGVVSTKEYTVGRGQLVNFTDVLTAETEPSRTPLGPLDDTMGYMGPMGEGLEGMGPQPTGPRRPTRPTRPTNRTGEPPIETKINYYTDMLLLDMTGGNRLPGRDRDLTQPANILFLDPDGNLTVRNELDDRKEVESLQFDEDEQTGRYGPGYMPGQGMEEGGMGILEEYGQPPPGASTPRKTPRPKAKPPRTRIRD